MKILYIISLSLLIVPHFSLAYAQNYQQKAHDECLKQAQDKYDQCEELAHQMKGDAERTSEANAGKKLAEEGCAAQLQKDLSKCKSNKN